MQHYAHAKVAKSEAPYVQINIDGLLIGSFDIPITFKEATIYGFSSPSIS